MTGSKESVSEFYGRTVGRTEDLIFSACRPGDYDPALRKNLTEEVQARRYGCENPIPDLLEGRTLIDLGSGAGADCFIAAQLVGETGMVVGVDMTPELLEIARRNVDPIMKKIGYAEPNVRFVEGHIEEIPIETDYADLVISNCVINLSSDKARIFREIWRVLKPGGEFFISDIVSDRRIPEELKQKDARLHSECYTGAAYIGDLHRMMKSAGFVDVRTVTRRRLDETIDGVHFESLIIRGFKLDLEEACEDYGQVAVYRGTIPQKPKSFTLDVGTVLTAGEATRVCKNSADMLRGSRYAPHFVVSEPIFHMGLFDCGPMKEPPAEEAPAAPAALVESSGSGCC